jgi:hypothetical protein
MDPLTELHRTLQVAAMLLDSAAGQIRDAKLLPVKSNIHKIGEALASVFEIQSVIYKQAPELQLEPNYEEPPEEVRLANRRLGEAMLAADALADEGKFEEARSYLANFAASEPSENHGNLALHQATRYAERDDA